MNRMLKFAMAAVIALVAGGAQAQVTGKTVLNDNANAWIPGTVFPGSEWTVQTGSFHAGGVAACDGCHVMHNASNGKARSTQVAPWTDAVPAFLLQGSDQSSTCLLCHGDTAAALPTTPYVIANTGATSGSTFMNYSPGGDFGWLKVDFTKSPKDRHGHNVAALDFSMGADGLMKTAPGGTYTPAASGPGQFACSSCHDPHGRYRMQVTTGTSWTWAGPVVGGGVVAIDKPIWASGSYGALPSTAAAVGSYRLLAGYGYVPASSVANPSPFPNNPPLAIAPTGYNKAEGGTGSLLHTNEVRVAYGAGMSEWCQNCHTNIHLDNYVSGAMGASGLRHPAGNGAVLKPGQYDVYNRYISSGKYNGTPDGTFYTSLVPFENAKKITYNGTTGTTDDIQKLSAAVAGTANGIFVASAESNVMCLSCHRAHASGFGSMVRWNPDDTFITAGSATVWPDTQNRGALMGPAYYGRTPNDFGWYQRSLCNKCHGKD